MYKKAWYTCKVVVLRNKPIAFFTSWLPSLSSLLKHPTNRYATRRELNASPKKERKKKENSRAVCKTSRFGAQKTTAVEVFPVVASFAKGHFSDGENWGDDRKYVCVRWLTSEERCVTILKTAARETTGWHTGTQRTVSLIFFFLCVTVLIFFSSLDYYACCCCSCFHLCVFIFT